MTNFQLIVTIIVTVMVTVIDGPLGSKNWEKRNLNGNLESCGQSRINIWYFTDLQCSSWSFYFPSEQSSKVAHDS